MASNGNEPTDELPKPVIKGGCFSNPWDTWKEFSKRNVAHWLLCAKNNSNVPKNKADLDKVLPVNTPDYKLIARPTRAGMIRVTWLGHAGLLVQMEGLNILTDPVFSQRCSPSQSVGNKRFRDAPCSVGDLPQIHAVVISHNHYDHLDLTTVQELNKRFGDGIRWFVPRGLASWMIDTLCTNVVELDWWLESCIADKPQVKFVFTPAQHWSSRTLFDKNQTLWGSWCVIGEHSKFYFAGDTGYCPVFKQIGDRYEGFDLAAIPIGAYDPRWMMKCQHVDPEEAVQIHLDVKAKKSIGIHWGTFCLANEFYLEPPEKLREAMEQRKLPVDDFFVLDHGESREITDTYNTVD